MQQELGVRERSSSADYAHSNLLVFIVLNIFTTTRFQCICSYLSFSSTLTLSDTPDDSILGFLNPFLGMLIRIKQGKSI